MSLLDTQISTRYYNEYHRAIWRMLRYALKKRKILFQAIRLNKTPPGMGYPRGPGLISITGDLLVIWSEDFLWYTPDDLEKLSITLDELLAYNKPILLLTSVDRADLDFDLNHTNLTFLHYGGDIMYQAEQYPRLHPQRKKNHEANYHWISLNRSVRAHRILAACCLLGHGLGDQTVHENHGLLRISNFVIKDFQKTWQQCLEVHCRDLGPTTPEQDRLLQYGYDRFLDSRNGGHPDGSTVYVGSLGCDNVRNFDERLRILYENSVVEIVNETLFFSRGIFVTEKFQNSVYGFNLPIILSSPGTVDYLRQHGFDMFDDVIDHEYDHIYDPIQRIFRAIESNSRLLTDPDYARACWQRCLPRLENNYQYAKRKMYQHFRIKVRKDLDHYLDAIQKDRNIGSITD